MTDIEELIEAIITNPLAPTILARLQEAIDARHAMETSARDMVDEVAATAATLRVTK